MSEVSLWVDDRGLAPQSRAVTCFSEETKWSRWGTYVALGNGREQYTEVTSHHSSLINIHVSRSTIETCWHSNFFVHCSNLLTLTLFPTVPLLHLREPSLSISMKNALFSLQKLKTLEPQYSKVRFLFTDHFVIYDFAACNMLITAWAWLWFSHFFVHSFPLFLFWVFVFLVFSGFVEFRHLFPLKFLFFFPF